MARLCNGRHLCLPYPAASLPPGPQNRIHVMTSLPQQTTRLETGRYGSQGWPPLREQCRGEKNVKISGDFFGEVG
jgi:hypothetical protein